MDLLKKTTKFPFLKTICIIAMLAIISPLIHISYKISFPKESIVSRILFLFFSILGLTSFCCILKKKIARVLCIMISCILLLCIFLLHCLELFNYSYQQDYFNYEFYMSMFDIDLIVEQIPYNLNFLIFGVIYILLTLIIFVFSTKTFNKSRVSSNIIVFTFSFVVVTTLLCARNSCIGYFVKMVYEANNVESIKNNTNTNTIDYSFFEKKGISTSNVGHDNLVIKSEGNRKNLIFIILESFENNFLDEELFPGLASNLNRFRKDNGTINFSNMDQYAGNTASSMFQSFWGFPIIPIIWGQSAYSYLNYESLNNFCSLPYIFTKAGYSWEHIQSTSLSVFEKALTNEGISFEYVDNKKKNRDDWKGQDKKMFEYAWELFQTKNNTENKPFVISISTMDSHGPDGRVFDDTLEYPNKAFFSDNYKYFPLLNATYTTDYYLGQFIDKVLNSPLGKDTIISIMNDHRFMGNPDGVLLSKKYRKNIFMILNTKKGQEVTTKGCQIDIAPTIIDLFGIETNYTFPLGISLLSANNKKDFLVRTLKNENQKDFNKYINLRCSTTPKTSKSNSCFVEKDNNAFLNVFGTLIPCGLDINTFKMVYISLLENREVEDHRNLSLYPSSEQIKLIDNLFRSKKACIFLFRTNSAYEAEEKLFDHIKIDNHSNLTKLGKYGLIYYGADGKVISSFSDNPNDLLIDIDYNNVFADKPIIKLPQEPMPNPFSYLSCFDAKHINQINNHIEISGKNIKLLGKRFFPASEVKPFLYSYHIKNTGASPVRVYSGFSTNFSIKEDGDSSELSLHSELHDPSPSYSQGIIIDAKKGNNYIIVQGESFEFENSMNDSIEIESYSSDISNSRIIPSRIISSNTDINHSLVDIGPVAVPKYITKFEQSDFTKVVLDSPLSEDIERGTLISFSPSSDAFICQEDTILDSGQDKVFIFQYPFSSPSDTEKSKNLFFIKPAIFFVSPDNKQECSISIFDFSVH